MRSSWLKHVSACFSMFQHVSAWHSIDSTLIKHVLCWFQRCIGSRCLEGVDSLSEKLIRWCSASKDIMHFFVWAFSGNGNRSNIWQSWALEWSWRPYRFTPFYANEKSRFNKNVLRRVVHPSCSLIPRHPQGIEARVSRSIQPATRTSFHVP